MLIDKKFPHHVGRYAFQCLLAMLALMVILFLLDVFSQTAIIASFGASAFVLFVMPHTREAGPRVVIPSYLIGCLMGVLFKNLVGSGLLTSLRLERPNHYIVATSLAVGVSIFFMALLNAEHPPAAGLAFSLIVNTWSYTDIAIVLLGITLLTLVKHLLMPVLKNLY